MEAVDHEGWGFHRRLCTGLCLCCCDIIFFKIVSPSIIVQYRAIVNRWNIGHIILSRKDIQRLNSIASNINQRRQQPGRRTSHQRRNLGISQD